MTEVFYNKAYQKFFKKTDCPEDLGSEELFVVPEAHFVGVTQADADRKAMEYAEVEGPKYANKYGGCCDVYYNTRQEADFVRKCEEGYGQVEPTHHIIEAGTVFSKFSIEDANYEARKKLKAEGQALADATGECGLIYYSEPQHRWFQKECREGWEGPSKYRRLKAGAATSFISVEDANTKAMAILEEEGQEWVESNTQCYPVSGSCSNDKDFE